MMVGKGGITIMKAKQNPSEKIGIAKFWGWQARAISMGSMVIILGYLQIYCTDTLGLNAAIVGTIMLVSKIVDAFTDLVAGLIIDNTHTKLGKARPYELALFPLWICTWLLFSCPEGFGTTAKYIWVFFMYVFVNSIFATALYSNQTAYMLRAFDTNEKIVKVNSYGGIVVTLGCAVVSMTFPQAMATIATSASGWSRMIGMFALPLLLIGLLRFFLVKETVEIDGGTAGKVSFRDMLEVIKTNPYIFIVAGISLLYNITVSMSGYTYYFTWVGGGIANYTSLAAVSMPLLIVMFIFPVLMKKGIPMSRIILFGALCGVFGYSLNFFAGASMGLLLFAAVFYTFAGLPIAYLSGLLILDCAEYNVLCGRKRMETSLTALSSFATKVGQGLGSVVIGSILTAFGYDGTAAVQSASAILGIKLCFSFIPAAAYLLIAILCMVYKLDGALAKKRAEAAAKAKAEA